MNADSLRAADEVIAGVLAETGINYEPARNAIAELFDDYLWNGTYQMSTDLDPDLGLKDLWLILEDEYEQSMDEDEKPDWDSQIGYFAGHYVFWS